MSGKSYRTLAAAVASYLERCVVTEAGCLVSPSRPDWYGEIKFDGKRTTAHRAVYMVAFGELEQGEVVRHRCDNPPCVNLAHLERGSVAQNVRDAYDRNRRSSKSGVEGESNTSAKLTADLVVAMRRAHRGGQTLADVARTFQAPYSAVVSAVRGLSWKHVVVEPPVPQTRRWSTPNRARSSDDDARRAQDLASKGFNLTEIAADLGCSRCTAFDLTHRGVAV